MAAEAVPVEGVVRFWSRASPRARTVAALALLFLATVPLQTKIFTSDYGTHLALGRHIVQNHEIPSKERWNYPSLGMANGSGGEWGFQAVLYTVHVAGGEYGVSALLWVVVLGIYFLLHRAMVLRGANPIVAVLALFAFSGFLRIRIQPRPEIFTYLFIAATICMLSEYYFGERKRLIYAFPALILVWANCHPTYLMAFALCGAFFADALIRAAYRREMRWPLVRSWAITPVVTGILGLVVCGLNPHGYDWLLAPLHLISRGEGTDTGSILTSISELTPVRETGMFGLYKAAALFAGCSFLLGAYGRRVYLLDLFLCVIAFKGAWSSARAVSMMGLFISPGVALHVSGAIARLFPPREDRPGAPVQGRAAEKREKRDRPGKGRREAKAPLPPPRAGAAAWGRIAASVAIAAALFVFGGRTLVFSFSQLEYGLGITEHKFSFGAADFLRKNPVPGNMFNFFDIGGFLDWQVYPGAMTFIDGRAYNRQVFMEHQSVTAGMPGWKNIVEKYGITYMVLKSMDSSGMILPIVERLAVDPEWELVYTDGLFLIFVKRSPATAGYIEGRRIDKSMIPRHIAWEAYHYVYLGVSPIVAYQTMSNMYLVMGDRANAVGILKKLLEIEDNPVIRNKVLLLERGKTSF